MPAEGDAAGTVRDARAADLDRVAELWVAITEHHRPLDPLFTMRRDAAVPLRELLFALYRDPDCAIFVYEEPGPGGDVPGQIVGMAIVRVDLAPPILEEVERAEITDLGVRASHRRLGIGRLLLDEALAWVRSRGVERVELQVAAGNREGQAFWRALGFGELMHVLHKRL